MILKQNPRLPKMQHILANATLISGMFQVHRDAFHVCVIVLSCANMYICICPGFMCSFTWLLKRCIEDVAKKATSCSNSGFEMGVSWDQTDLINSSVSWDCWLCFCLLRDKSMPNECFIEEIGQLSSGIWYRGYVNFLWESGVTGTEARMRK